MLESFWNFHDGVKIHQTLFHPVRVSAQQGTGTVSPVCENTDPGKASSSQSARADPETQDLILIGDP
jgi:hypothetical protein